MNSNYKSLTAAMCLSLALIAGSAQAQQHSQSHTDDAEHGDAGGQQCQMMQAGGGNHGAQAEQGNGQGMDHGQCQMMQAGNGQHGSDTDHGDGHSMDHSQHQMMQADNGGHGAGQGMGASSQPVTAGQSGFAAIQEVVAMLEADPATDWTQVNLDRLRSHLIDMDRVMIDATVQSSDLANGMRHRVSGDEQITASIKRMVPAHVEQMRTELSWAISMSEDSSGVELEITASESSQIAKIKGLGFAGFMALGDHHQAHHMQMATGESHQH